MSEKITAMIEEIKALSVLELSELVHALEDTFGVSAAAYTCFAVACFSAFWHMATASQTGLPFSSVTSSSP